MKVLVIFLFFSTFFIMLNARAKNLGTIGQTYPVIEIDFLTFIQEKARAWINSDAYQQQQKIIVRGVDQYARHPKYNLARHTTDHPRTYYIDPSVKRNDMLFSSKEIGSINPFDSITYHKTLVFIDADDTTQVKWFKEFSTQHTKPIHLVLVGGDVVSASKQFKRRVFFDQHEKLTNYFQLKYVPVVIQEDKTQEKWRVQEINALK